MMNDSSIAQWMQIDLRALNTPVSVWQAGNEIVLQDTRMLTGEEAYTPTDAKDLANKLLYTCYMGTQNSSAETRHRAKALASEIGAYHRENHPQATLSSLVSVLPSVDTDPFAPVTTP